MQEQLKIWVDDDYYCYDDELIEWYDVYKKHKTQKAQIKEELMPIAWHSSRYCDWCMSADKRNKKIVGINTDLFVSGDRIQKIDPHLGLRMGKK